MSSASRESAPVSRVSNPCWVRGLHGLKPSVTVVLLSALMCSSALAQATQPVLHIAADPNNLPFTNDKLEGFENKIAQLIADDLGAKVEYTWLAQRRGFFRDTLKHGDAEIVMGVPAEFEKGTI